MTDSPKMSEIISDFATSCHIQEVKDNVYTFSFINNMSHNIYTIQITKSVFDLSFENRTVHEDRAELITPKKSENLSV